MKPLSGIWEGHRLVSAAGQAQHHPLPSSAEAYFPIDLTNLYLGIDDSKDDAVRAVCLDGAAPRLPFPISCQRFRRPGKLLAYVKSFIRDAGMLHVAIRRPNRISRPALFHLEEIEGIPVARLSRAETLTYEEAWDQLYGVEAQCFEAFGLALTVAYRQNASLVLEEMRQVTNEATSKMNEVRRTLDHLYRATRVPF